MSDSKLSDEYIACAKHGRDFIFGVDLGQARDYTAIVVLERFEELTGEAAKGQWLKQVRYEISHLERPSLGTPYPAIIGRLKELIAGLPDYERLKIVVDRTGVGRPVVDLMRKEKLSVIPVTITAGGYTAQGLQGGNGKPTCGCSATIRACPPPSTATIGSPLARSHVVPKRSAHSELSRFT